MEKRRQLALESVLGDSELTSALTDEEAQILLTWARQEIDYWVAQTQGMEDEDAWEIIAPPIRALRKQIRHLAHVSSTTPGALAELSTLMGQSGAENTDTGDPFS
ncbi:MAG: hypothetical protein JXB35_09130 [Anaerolineae bacterium]|nr:hypothetical protein [Anaerolineae bacterium]